MEVDLMFTRAREAVDSGNYAYAITLLQDILYTNPDHEKARIAMHGCAMTLFQKRGGNIIAKITGFLKGLGPFLTASLARAPEKIIPAVERFLAYYPMHRSMLMRWAKALEAQGHLEGAAQTLELARQHNPNNINLLTTLGRVYVALEDYKKAVRCYEELVRLRPTKREFHDTLKNLMSEGHLKITDKKSARENVRDKELAEQLIQEDRLLHSLDEIESAIAHQQARLRENAGDADAWLKLGDLLVRKDDFEFARQAYEKAYELNPGFITESKLTDLDLRLLQHIEEAAAAAAKADPANAALKAQSQAARERRLDEAIRILTGRVEQHPTEVPLRFDLAQAHFERGRKDDIAKAVTSYQKTVADPRFRDEARYMLGRCFARDDNTLDVALNQFKLALDSPHTTQQERIKDIMYRMAEIYERMDKKAEALSWYKKVFELDAGYREVAAKVEQLS